MNRDEAIKRLEHSLATEEARVITPSGKTYEEHIETLAKSLRTSVIEPVRVQVTSTCAAGGDFDTYRSAVVWAIARSGNNWLLTLETQAEFALGFGDDPLSIKMHGFSSSDALGEWCA